MNTQVGCFKIMYVRAAETVLFHNLLSHPLTPSPSLQGKVLEAFPVDLGGDIISQHFEK